MTNVNPTSLKITQDLSQLNAPAKTEAKAEPKAKVHVCPGHTELFHRYMKESKAERKAAKEVQNLEKKKEIDSARFSIIAKKSEPNCGFFNGLNKIYRFAAVITVKHVDGSTKCPHHPEHKA